MIIIKKNVVLKDAETGGTGVLKLERFMNRTSGRILLNCPKSAKAYIDIDGNISKVDAALPFDLDAEITQSSLVKAVVADDGTIIATGNSSGGKFNYAALINAAHSGSENMQSDILADESEEIAEELIKESAPQSDTADEEISSTAEASAAIKTAATAEIKSEKPAAVKENPGAKSKKRKSGKPSFIDSIRNNLQQLFDTYPAEEKLISMMPSSRWVKVPTEEDGYYVVGITQEDGNPKYLCYGIPDTDNSAPPKSRPECRDWLSVEEDGSGYWLMYQDLESGEILKKETV